MHIDPDFYQQFGSFIDDDGYDGESCEEDMNGDYFDTYDEIVSPEDITAFNEEFEDEVDELNFDLEADESDGELDATALGMAFALADEITDAERMRYSVDENTDSENLRKAIRLTSLHGKQQERSRLRPFETYIQEVCQGRKPMFKNK